MAERLTKEERKAANRAELDRLRAEIVQEEVNTIIQPEPINPSQPTRKSKEVVDEICRRILDDESLSAICRDPHMPAKVNFLRWVKDDDDVRTQYTRARAQSGHTIYSKIQELETELKRDKVDDKKFRCLVDSMKWRAGRMHGKYNEKIIIEQTGKQELSIVWQDDTQGNMEVE